MTNEQDFDSRAATWDEESRRVQLAREVVAGIIAAVKPTAQMTALDFGCGTGLVTLNLQPYVGSIDGIDNATGMLNVLEKKCRDSGITNVRALHCDLERGERPEGRYDLIVSSMTLHHVADIPPLFRMFGELLKPDGAVCLADLDKEDGTFHDDPSRACHFGFERAGIKRMLAEAGFTALQDATVSTIRKRSPPREYPIFLISGRKEA